MIPDKFKCPECGGDPKGTAETIPGVAFLAFDEEGKPFYEGGTKIEWDGQTTERQCETGEIVFVCGGCSEEYSVPGVTAIE